MACSNSGHNAQCAQARRHTIGFNFSFGINTNSFLHFSPLYSKSFDLLTKKLRFSEGKLTIMLTSKSLVALDSAVVKDTVLRWRVGGTNRSE